MNITSSFRFRSVVLPGQITIFFRYRHYLHNFTGFHPFQIKSNMNSQVSSSEGCSCDDVTAGNTVELTLDNFDNDEIPDDCPFVLTSPRSLEACKVVGVRVSTKNFLHNDVD